MKSKLYKKYTKILGYILVLFILFNFITYKVIVEEFVSNKDYFTGDIARLDYVKGFETYRPKYESTLPNKHIEAYKIPGLIKEMKSIEVDVITIGDSFFHGGGYGKNPYFQDYLVGDSKLTVLDIPKLRPYNNFETVVGLIDNGFFNKVKPKYLIIGGLWTGFKEEFSSKLRSDIDIDIGEYFNYIENKQYVQKFPEYGFINTGNVMFFLKNLDRYLNLDLVHKNSFQVELDRSLFSLDHNKLLYYYKSKNDFNFSPEERLNLVKKMNSNFEILSQKMGNLGVKLIVLPIPSKLTLYNKFIQDEDEKFEEHNFIETFIQSNVTKMYAVLNTRVILDDMLKSNIKDVWYGDDTHWSFRASKKVSNSIINSIE
jgi:hypothetical protein